MAIIKCPECGRDVSDKAKSCPNCGCPIEEASPSGLVRIKVSALRNAINGNQTVTISSKGMTLWEGRAGEIAEIYFKGPTNVDIFYHMSLLHYGGSCEGTIDPSKSKRYAISVRQGVMSTKLVLQPVDVFDSDL